MYYYLIFPSILLIPGIYLLITGCNPKYTQTCALYNTFHGSIYNIEFINNKCIYGDEIFNCWSVVLHAKSSDELSSGSSCATTIIERMASFKNIEIITNGYDIGHHVDWIKDNNGKCYYAGKLGNKYYSGIILTCVFSIVYFVWCLLLYLNNKKIKSNSIQSNPDNLNQSNHIIPKAVAIFVKNNDNNYDIENSTPVEICTTI